MFKFLFIIFKMLIGFIIILPKYTYSQCSDLATRNHKKTAYILGNNEYKFVSKLDKSVNDANDIADSLIKIGFEVNLYVNDQKDKTEESLKSWINTLRNYDVALFYYSGHGLEYDGTNFLLPIDANPKSPSELGLYCISANTIMDQISSQGIKFSFIILDACRSNPFSSGWIKNLSNNGLSSMSAEGTFIGFAAHPKKIAMEGKGRNGFYTEGILKYLTEPNITVDQLFTKVNAYVRRLTNNEQVPFKNSSLGVEYCFTQQNKFTELDIVNDKNNFVSGSNIISNTRDQIISIRDSTVEVRSLSTNNIIKKYELDNFIPSYLLIIEGDKFACIDTTQKEFQIIESGSNRVKKVGSLDYIPKMVFKKKNENSFYYTYSIDNKYGFCKFDIDKASIKNCYLSNSEIINIFPTNSNDIIYIVTKDSIKQFNLSTSRTIRSKGGLKTIKNTILVEGGEKFLVYRDSNSNNILTHINQSNFRSKNVNIETNHSLISSGNDSLIYSYYDREFLVIRISDGKIIASQRLPGRILGMTIVDQNHIILLLDSYIALYTLNVTTLIDSNFKDPKYIFNRYIEDERRIEKILNKNIESDDIIRFADTIRWQIDESIKELEKISELKNFKRVNEPSIPRILDNGIEYGKPQTINDTTYFGFKRGVKSVRNGKMIALYFYCSLSNGNLEIKPFMYQNLNYKITVYRNMRSKIDPSDIRLYISNIFMSLVDYLRD